MSETHGGSRPRHRVIFWLVALAALVAGLGRAWSLRWVCDDAFITFRYVDNLLAGRGLVYNAGERVEGYTHFLWLCLITAWRALGVDPVMATRVLGLLSYAGLLLLAAATSARLFRSAAPVIPFTTLALAVHHEMNIWATGGLETMLYSVQVLLGFFLVAAWRSPRPVRFILAGSVFTLAILTRPDAVLFGCTAFCFLALCRPPGRSLGLFLAPFLILLPWLAWKLAYYGQLLPNPYYAKSGGVFYYSQGFRYAWDYFRPYTTSLLALGAIPLLVRRAWRAGGNGWPARLGEIVRDPADGPLALATAFLLVYVLLFVTRVGGDFMYARFLVPVIPLIYLVLETLAYRLLGRWRRVLPAVLLLFPLLLLGEARRRDAIYFHPDGTPKSAFGVHGVTDEHWYYAHRINGLTLIEHFRVIGEQLQVYFEGLDVRVLLRGQAALGYYGRFPVCIENAGLTDRTIARLPTAHRGRPGHEKAATPEYLVQRGVHFVFQKPPDPDRPYRFASFLVQGQPVRAEIICYDRVLMRRLRERYPAEIQFTDFETYLDGWMARLPGLPEDQARREYAEFRDYYFRGNQDPERESRILALLGQP
jgi:hypothetical protein